MWWLRLGIPIERIKPGNPQHNGRHERMHLTLKHETTRPNCFNFLQQRARFDGFIEVFNNDRPHHALRGEYPGEVYTPAAREYSPTLVSLHVAVRMVSILLTRTDVIVEN